MHRFNKQQCMKIGYDTRAVAAKRYISIFMWEIKLYFYKSYKTSSYEDIWINFSLDTWPGYSQ